MRVRSIDEVKGGSEVSIPMPFAVVSAFITNAISQIALKLLFMNWGSHSCWGGSGGSLLPHNFHAMKYPIAVSKLFNTKRLFSVTAYAGTSWQIVPIWVRMCAVRFSSLFKLQFIQQHEYTVGLA